MDRAIFYDALRKRDSGVFGTSLSQGQVDGMENLLNVWFSYYYPDPLDQLAISLATAYHETAHTMQPIRERGPRRYFDKYEPGTRIGKILGNVLPGDGYRFRGQGHVQNTGRANARKASRRLNEVFDLGVDLESRPEMRGDPFISAHSLFLGCREGWWTGKEWTDYLDGVDEDDDEDLREFIASRRVVNGTDKAEKIGRHALAFEKALRAAGYGQKPPAKPKDARQPVPGPKTPAKPEQPSATVPVALSVIAATFILLFNLIAGFVQSAIERIF